MWRQLFAPLAKTSKEVFLFDKYLFSRLFEVADEHLTWMLGKLDETMPRGSKVHLVAARGTPGEYGADRVPRDAREAESKLREYLPQALKNIGEIEVVLAPSVRARDMHHDRHIRFSSGAGVELPAGFDRLQDRTLGENFGFSYRSSLETLRELLGREQAVRGVKGAHVFTVRYSGA